MAQRGDARYRRLKYPPTAAVAISSEYFVVGGGGGKAKTGVPNRITLVADSKPDLLVRVIHFHTRQVSIPSRALPYAHAYPQSTNFFRCLVLTCCKPVL